MKPALLFLLTLPALCFGNETTHASDAWTTAFFTDRFELRLTPPSDPALTLRWSPDGLTPRATAQPWSGPLLFAESTRFRSLVFQGSQKAGDPVPRNLIRLGAALPTQQADAGLWTRLKGGPWTPLADAAGIPVGSSSLGTLLVPQSGLCRLVWTEAHARVSLGEFTFAKAEQAEAPFWIEAGSYPLAVETRPEVGAPVFLVFKPLDASAKAPGFRRASAPPSPLFSGPGSVSSAASDGFLGTAWTIPSGDEDKVITLNFNGALEGGLVLVTDPSHRRFPAAIRLPDGKILTAVAVGPGSFHAALPGPTTSVSLVQPAGAAEWPLFELLHQPADIRPFPSFALNCLPGDEPSDLPALRRLAVLATDLWPRMATSARHDPRSFPRQLWLGAVPSQADPVRVLGRHFLVSRDALGKPETAALLVQKLGELAARPVGDTPPDIAQGLGAGVVLLTLGAEAKLPGGGSFALPKSERGRRAALAALESPSAFLALLRSARTSFDGSLWKQFEAASLNRKPTEN